MKNIYKKLSWFIKQEWKRYLILLVLLTMIIILSLIPAFFLGLAIDTIISGDLTKTTLLYLVGALALIPTIRYFTSYIYNYQVSKLAQQLTYELREKYIQHLFKMDLSFYSKYEKGDLINRATTDLEAITLAATGLLEGIILNFGIILFALVIMIFTINFKLTIISVTIMPIGLTILNVIRHKKRKYILIHRKIYAKLTETVLESVEGQKTIRAYGEEDANLKIQKDAVIDDIESWRYIVKYENWFAPLFEVIYGVAYVLAFVFGVYFIVNSQLTVGSLITFVTYIGMLYGPIISMSTIFSQINNATISLDRFNEILEEVAITSDKTNAKPILTFNEINFKNVTYKYPFDKKPVIKSIDFTIKKGQTIGIVGPTGAGKSTLIRQLLREFDVSEGEVTIDGININEYKLENVRNLVGYVPQAHTIFRKKVLENIKVGNSKADRDSLDKAVIIADFAKDLPYLESGLQTMVSEAGATLSGGQKQRLSIARALIKEPEILILDDSLSAVDANTEDNIIQRLKDFRGDKTNIIVAHRFSAIKDADLIIVLEEGQITMRGTHEELLKQDGWYKKQYINQITML